MVAMKAKASGTPPKLASTPDGGEHQPAQQQVPAGLQDRDGQRQPQMAPITAVMTDSCRLPR